MTKKRILLIRENLFQGDETPFKQYGKISLDETSFERVVHAIETPQEPGASLINAARRLKAAMS